MPPERGAQSTSPIDQPRSLLDEPRVAEEVLLHVDHEEQHRRVSFTVIVTRSTGLRPAIGAARRVEFARPPGPEAR